MVAVVVVVAAVVAVVVVVVAAVVVGVVVVVVRRAPRRRAPERSVLLAPPVRMEKSFELEVRNTVRNLPTQGACGPTCARARGADNSTRGCFPAPHKGLAARRAPAHVGQIIAHVPHTGGLRPDVRPRCVRHTSPHPAPHKVIAARRAAAVVAM